MRSTVRRRLLASSVICSLTAIAAPAFAQEGGAPPTEQAAEAASVDELVVTGSRIRRPDLTSVQPLQVITAQSMEARGFTNVADALNDLPSAGVPVSPIGDQGSFGVGRNFLNIFNLGSNRTLTLVNGRRFVGGNPASIFTGANAGGQVDLNVIPTGLIDRIETIQAGGSAVYGSDAIAGVVNVITRTDFEGVELDGQYGISGRDDAEEWRGRITAGRSFLDGRLNLSGSYEYNETSALGFVDRKRTREQLTFAANPNNRTGTDAIPGSIIILDRRIPEVTLGGLPFRSNAGGTAIGGIASSFILTIPGAGGARVPAQFGPDGTLIPYDPGLFYQASVASGGDGLNLAELSSLQSPVERHVATAFARYDVTDNIRVSGEFYYSKFDTEEPFNQPIYNAPLFGGNSAALRVSTANPFLPAATRAALLAQPTALAPDPANPGEGIFFLSRASIDIGNNKTTSEGDTWRGVLAVDGDLNFFDRDFFWSLSFTQGEAEGSFQSPNIIQSRFAEAIDVVREGNNVVCRSATARAAGCRPLNLFGLGAPDQDALDYVGVQFESKYKILQTVYEGNFGGELLDLPAGPWSFAAGFESRYEKSDFNPNEPQELGVGRSAAITGLAGKFDTQELYVETLVPVFGGDFTFPLMHRLELEGAYRRVDHSQAGKDKAWSYGGRWYPFADLMIRGQKSRSFRAPAITELFLPNATSFMTATDPCDFRNIGVGPNPATRTANCRAAFQALGLPADFSLTSNVQAATVQGSTAGNPDLGNEIADQWTVGFVYQPSFVPGLAINFDWVNIKIEGAISNFTLTSILQVCYDSPNPPADACGRFERGNSTTDPTTGQGQIITRGNSFGPGVSDGPRTGFINAGYTNFEGFTAGVDYRVELSDWLGGAFGSWFGGDPGAIQWKGALYHVKRQETSVTGLGFDLNRDHGEIGNAKWRWKLDTSYDRGPLSVNWTINWIDKSKFNNDFNLETRFPLDVESYFLNDVGITYDFEDVFQGYGVNLQNVRARLVVRNVFDEEPPIGATNSANAYGTYDFIGRYYVVGLTARF